MNKKKIELLAPAGDYQAFLMAVQNGADAVYLAGKNFGARAYANNFSDDELIQIIKYAHIRDVKIYVTINTIIFDSEIGELIKFVDFLYQHDCDGLIVQDLGIISLIQNNFPDFPIHVSTQFNTHNLDQIKFLENLKVTRIVLARECSIEQIEEITKNTTLEIEVFCHGALCQGFSGQCLMSSFIGKRSGNRGKCGQPCRMEYCLINDNGFSSEPSYLLSTKDLFTINNIKDLIDAGISCLKIEGRMKSPEYVATIVRNYRQAIDAYYNQQSFVLPKSQLDEIKLLFNREFTKGYLFNEDSKDLVNTYRPNHQGLEIGSVISFNKYKAKIKLSNPLSIGDGIRITSDKDVGCTVNKIYKDSSLISSANIGDIIEIEIKEPVYSGDKVLKTLDISLNKNVLQMIDKENKKIPLASEFIAHIGSKASFKIKDERNNEVIVETEDIVAKLENSFISKEVVEKQLQKLSSTPYFLNTLKITIDNNILLPIATINNLRRTAIELLNEKRKCLNNYRNTKIKNEPIKAIPTQEPKLKVLVRTEDQLMAALDLKIADIYLPIELYQKHCSKYPNLIPFLPRINFGFEEDIDSKKILINHVGSIQKNLDKEIISNLYLNIVNFKSVYELLKSKVSVVTLSPELSFLQIENLLKNFKKQYNFTPNLEVVVYGYLDSMITKYCPIRKTMNSNINCNLCKTHQYYLSDRFDYRFPLFKEENCIIHILNSQRLQLIDYLYQIKKLGISGRLEFTIESKGETSFIIKEFLKAFNNEKYQLELPKVTYGHFKTGIE